MISGTLVELCAGTASVSLWALARCSPLTGYMGSKRRWAPALVQALGVDRPSRVVLVDAGPWGDVWSVLRVHDHRWRVAAQLDAWAGQDVAALWERLVVEPPPTDTPAWRIAQFLWLQARAAGCIPVWWSVEHGRWRSPTGAVDPERSMDLARRTTGLPDRVGRATSKGIAPSVAGRRGFGSGRRTAALIASRVRALDALPWGRIEVVHGDLRNVEPIPGATVYLDPPYVGCPRYAALCPRADVLRVARRWADAGCRVAVSEATPLVLPGVDLVDGSTGAPLLRGWTSRRLARREWVTASWPLSMAEQLDLYSGVRVVCAATADQPNDIDQEDQWRQNMGVEPIAGETTVPPERSG